MAVALKLHAHVTLHSALRMEMGRQVGRGGVRPQGPAPHAIRGAVQGPGVARPPARAPPALPAAVGSVRGRPAPRQALLPFAGARAGGGRPSAERHRCSPSQEIAAAPSLGLPARRRPPRRDPVLIDLSPPTKWGRGGGRRLLCGRRHFVRRRRRGSRSRRV